MGFFVSLRLLMK
jgi:hypothetical protein